MRKAPQRQSGLIRKIGNVCRQTGVHLDADSAVPKASSKDVLEDYFPLSESDDESEILSRSNSRRESFGRTSSPRKILQMRKLPRFGRRSGILLNTSNPVRKGSRKDALDDYFSPVESDDESSVSTFSTARRETSRRSPSKAVENRKLPRIGRRSRREFIPSKAVGKNSRGKRNNNDDFDDYFSPYETDDTTSVVDDTRSSHAGSSRSKSDRQASNQVSNRSKAEPSLLNINSSVAHKLLKSPSHHIFVQTPSVIETAGVPGTPKASNKDVWRYDDQQAVVGRESERIDIQVGQSSVAGVPVTTSAPLNASNNMSYSQQLSRARTRLSFVSPEAHKSLPEFHKITPTKRPALHERRFPYPNTSLLSSTTLTDVNPVDDNLDLQYNFDDFRLNLSKKPFRPECVEERGGHSGSSANSQKTTSENLAATPMKSGKTSINDPKSSITSGRSTSKKKEASDYNIHSDITLENSVDSLVISRELVDEKAPNTDWNSAKSMNTSSMHVQETESAANTISVSSRPIGAQSPGRYTSVNDYSRSSRAHSLSAFPENRGNVSDRNDTRKSKNISSVREKESLVKTNGLSKRPVGRPRKNTSLIIEETDDTDADYSPKAQSPGRSTSVRDYTSSLRAHKLSTSPKQRGNLTDRNDMRESRNSSSIREKESVTKTSSVSKKIVGRPKKNNTVRIEETEETEPADHSRKARTPGRHASVHDYRNTSRARSLSASPEQQEHLTNRNDMSKFNARNDMSKSNARNDMSKSNARNDMSKSNARNDMSKSKNTSSVREKESTSKTTRVLKRPVGRPRKMITSEITDVSKKPNERLKRKPTDGTEEMENCDVDLSRKAQSPTRYTSMVDYAHSSRTQDLSASFEKSETVTDASESQLKSKNTSSTQEKKSSTKIVQKVSRKSVDHSKTMRRSTTMIEETEHTDDERSTSMAHNDAHSSRAVSASHEKLEHVKYSSGGRKSKASTVHFEPNSQLHTQSAATPEKASSVHKSIQADWEIESEEELVIDVLHSSLHREILSAVHSSSPKVAPTSRVETDSNLLFNGTSREVADETQLKWRKLGRPSKCPLLFETLEDEGSSSTLWGRRNSPNNSNDSSPIRELTGKEGRTKEKERKTKRKEVKVKEKKEKEENKKKEERREKTAVKRTREDLEDDWLSKEISEESVVAPRERPKRHRIKTLEHWRNERPIYRLNSDGCQSFVDIDPGFDPNIYEYKRNPQYVKGYMYSKKQSDEQMDDSDDTDSGVQIDQGALGREGFIQKENQGVIVINPISGEEVMIDCVKTKESHFAFSVTGEIATPNDDIILTKPLRQKAFSAGTIEIKAKTEKGLHNLKEDTMVFYVTRGFLEVTIHETALIVKKGDLFFIPQGNKYNLCNNSDSSTTLVFFQLKND